MNNQVSIVVNGKVYSAPLEWLQEQMQKAIRAGMNSQQAAKFAIDQWPKEEERREKQSRIV